MGLLDDALENEKSKTNSPRNTKKITLVFVLVLVLGIGVDGFSVAAEIFIIIIPGLTASTKFCEGSRSRQEKEAQEAREIFCDGRI